MKTMAAILLITMSPGIRDVGDMMQAPTNSVSLDRDGTASVDEENGLVFEADTDADGRPLEGTFAYLLRFEKEDLPQTGALWWLTLEDPADDARVEPHVRREISAYDGLRTGGDGSVTIYVQHDDPGAEGRTNWLRSPSGRFGLSLRIEATKAEQQSALWMPPPIEIAP